MNDLETMQNYMNLLKADAGRMFPGAVSVMITITAENVDVRPCYQKTEDREARTMDGGWA